jgi:hypothetical protein
MLSNGASSTNPTGTTLFGAGGITTVDQADNIPESGSTGFSSLGISPVFYLDATIGLLPQCVN